MSITKKLEDGYFNVTRLHRDDIKTQVCNRYGIEEDELPTEISERIDNLSDIDMNSLADDIEMTIMDDFWDVIDSWLDDNEDIEDGIEDMELVKEEDEDE